MLVVFIYAWRRYSIVIRSPTHAYARTHAHTHTRAHTRAHTRTHTHVHTHTHTQWLPPAWIFQWLFLLYRWVLAIYFGGWQLYIAIIYKDQGGKYLIYLTNWGFLIWVSYLLSAAVATTANFIQAWTCSHVIYFPWRHSSSQSENVSFHTNPACCGSRRSSDGTNCCDKLTWFLFVIGAETAVLVSVLFWTTLYYSEGATSPPSVHQHLVNGIVAIVDLWVSGVPVYLLHFVYVQLFGAVYVTFTGMYYAFDNKTSIYPVLDYQEDPGLAAGLAVGVVVFGTVIIHLLFLLQYLCRRAASTRLSLKYKKRYRMSFGASSTGNNTVGQHSSSSPSSSSSGSSSCNDTTPILSQKLQSIQSSQESYF